MKLQKISQKLRQGFSKIRGIYFYVLCLTLLKTKVVFATNKIEQSKAYTGTVALIKDAFRAIQLIDILAGVVIILILLGKKQMEDEVDSKATKKKIRAVVITMVVIILIVELLNLILGYYTNQTIQM